MDLLQKYNPLYSQANPPFEKLILTISFIVRSAPSIVDLNDANNFLPFENQQNEGESSIVELVLASRGTSPLHLPLTKSFNIPEGENVPVLQISDDCNKALFIS